MSRPSGRPVGRKTLEPPAGQRGGHKGRQQQDGGPPAHRGPQRGDRGDHQDQDDDDFLDNDVAGYSFRATYKSPRGTNGSGASIRSWFMRASCKLDVCRSMAAMTDVHHGRGGI